MVIDAGLPRPEREVQLIPKRRFKWDFVWEDERLAVEIQGGLHGTGAPCRVCKQRKPSGHTSAEGIQRDMEKNNLALLHGWVVLQFSARDLSDRGNALEVLAAALRQRRAGR